MTERERVLLLGLVAEYIRTGQPVGSVALARSLRLDCSPATIRSDLQELAEAGYIFKPHTSAGRVPMDAGYRFFVDHVRARSVAAGEREQLREEFATLIAVHQHLARTTARFLARLTDTPALSSQNEPPDVFESGLREFVQESDQENLDELKELSTLLLQLDEHFPEQSLPVSTSTAKVYIGAEITFMPAHHSSLVVRKVALPDGQTLTLVVLGPKRMRYQRNVALLNAVADIIRTL